MGVVITAEVAINNALGPAVLSVATRGQSNTFITHLVFRLFN